MKSPTRTSRIIPLLLLTCQTREPAVAAASRPAVYSGEADLNLASHRGRQHPQVLLDYERTHTITKADSDQGGSDSD